MKIFIRLIDPQFGYSLITKTRQNNFELFNELISTLPRPFKILDLGGTQQYWEKMDFTEKNVEIILLNLSKINVTRSNFKSVAGDARDLSKYKNKEFGI